MSVRIVEFRRPRMRLGVNSGMAGSRDGPMIARALEMPMRPVLIVPMRHHPNAAHHAAGQQGQKNNRGH